MYNRISVLGWRALKVQVSSHNLILVLGGRAEAARALLPGSQ